MPATWTILEACRSLGIDTPTLCYLENLTPVNVCRICVVELTGARTLVPACSRRVEPGMEITHRLAPRAAVAQDGDRIPRLIRGSLDRSPGPGIRGAVRRVPRALRAAATSGRGGGARQPRAGPSSPARRDRRRDGCPAGEG